ncbi:MAG: 16S rRNA (guanine(966)-N(2))-methyltransferase RsmD [Firmicutes bacterium]|nr:16S rRNA (guanine(966)-N(2))-methyltransferase RsmD [Bacillota bacterium]
MRVIAGKYKGRSLVAPKEDARPTLDRMKETLFNILNFKLENAIVLDLFAGSGQLAIESLSRGAERAILCDNSKQALSAIQANFSKINVRPEIIFGNYTDCLAKLQFKFDVVFVDPPYKSGYYLDVLQKLGDYDLLKSDGWIVCEHLASDNLPEQTDKFVLFDTRKIGTVKFDFYERRKLCE